MIENLVVFAHGKESGPWGHKITHLAETARQRGFDVLSPDYSHTHDPGVRLQQLLTLNPRAHRLVLAGSSMGGYVSAMACAELSPIALFLMAPALYFPGWDQEPQQIPGHCSVVHGWRDAVVPADRAIRFASQHRAELLMLDAEHSLNDCVERVAQAFDRLLLTVLQAP